MADIRQLHASSAAASLVAQHATPDFDRGLSARHSHTIHPVSPILMCSFRRSGRSSRTGRSTRSGRGELRSHRRNSDSPPYPLVHRVQLLPIPELLVQRLRLLWERQERHPPSMVRRELSGLVSYEIEISEHTVATLCFCGNGSSRERGKERHRRDIACTRRTPLVPSASAPSPQPSRPWRGSGAGPDVGRRRTKARDHGRVGYRQGDRPEPLLEACR
jgi:hypothetical protein